MTRMVRPAGFLLLGAKMFDLSIRSTVSRLEKQLDDLANRQLPFATAQALTVLAKTAVKAEQKNIETVFDRPTPFTTKSVGAKSARKSDLEAVVFMKDVAASYLEPYEFGGKNKLNAQALLRPANLSINQYGNLPRSKIKQLKARSDVFIGPVKTKSGQVINGVWQRPYLRERDLSRGNDAAARRKTRGQGRAPKGANTTGHLVLLIRFEDAHPATQHLGWFNLAQRVVAANVNREMGRALARAIASAK